MTEHFKAFIKSVSVALTGLTIAQFNALLGTVSLVVGLSYQVWKWRREASDKTD